MVISFNPLPFLGCVQEMGQMQIKLQQAQSSRNISENMNKMLQVSEPVHIVACNSACFQSCSYFSFPFRKS